MTTSGLLNVADSEVSGGTMISDGEEIHGMHAHRIVQKGIFQVLEGRRVFDDHSSPAPLTHSWPRSRASGSRSPAPRQGRPAPPA